MTEGHAGSTWNTVQMSDELLALLRKGWSEPVQIRVDQAPTNAYPHYILSARTIQGDPDDRHA